MTKSRCTPSRVQSLLTVWTRGHVSCHVRITPADDDEAETQFSLIRLHDGEVTAVTSTLRSPLHVQLRDLYATIGTRRLRTCPRASSWIASLARRRDCAGLVKIAGSFDRRKMPITIQNMLVVDPRQYEIWVDGGAQQIYVNLLAAASGVTRHPLIKWVESARKMFARCGNR